MPGCCSGEHGLRINSISRINVHETSIHNIIRKNMDWWPICHPTLHPPNKISSGEMYPINNFKLIKTMNKSHWASYMVSSYTVVTFWEILCEQPLNYMHQYRMVFICSHTVYFNQYLALWIRILINVENKEFVFI